MHGALTQQDPPARLSSSTSWGLKPSKKANTSASEAEYGRPRSRTTADGSCCTPTGDAIVRQFLGYMHRRLRLGILAGKGADQRPFSARSARLTSDNCNSRRLGPKFAWT